MKLHDPTTEREFRRLALNARGEKPVEPRDPLGIRKKLFGYCANLVTIGGVGIVLRVVSRNEMADCWQILICSIILMLVSLISLGALRDTVHQNGHHAVLANLPIPGRLAMTWVRNRFLFSHSFGIIACGALAAIFLHRIDAPFHTLAQSTILLGGVTFATIVLLEDENLSFFRIQRIWTLSSILLVVGMAVLAYTERRLFGAEGMPEWLYRLIGSIGWIYPTSWVMPGNLEKGGAFLALAWTGWGLWRWMDWPRIAGVHFDMPQDFIGVEFDEEHDDEEDWSATNQHGIDVEEPADGKLECSADGAHLNPLEMSSDGWVDRWISRCVGIRDHAVAGALADPDTTWTRQTNWLLRLLPVWLFAVWAFTEWVPECKTKESIGMWIWPATGIILLVSLLPFTNALPRMLASFAVGQQAIPFFAILPVGTRDILRISTRITIARSLVMMAIATPYLALQLAVIPNGTSPWIACWIVPAACLFWASSRPIFVWHRLNAACRGKKGTCLIRAIGTLLIVVLILLWLASGVVGVASGTGMLIAYRAADEIKELTMLAAGGMLASALSARAVFEIHHWHLRRGHFDWVAPQ